MAIKLRTYKNSAELANLNGVPIYMNDMVDAALRGTLRKSLSYIAKGNTLLKNCQKAWKDGLAMQCGLILINLKKE